LKTLLACHLKKCGNTTLFYSKYLQKNSEPRLRLPASVSLQTTNNPGYGIDQKSTAARDCRSNLETAVLVAA
jgi:hypothetical protein